MKAFTPIHLILIALLLISTTSCETLIDVDLPKHEPTLVLNSFFGTDTTFIATLHQDKDILDNSYDFKTVSGAQLTLYKDGELIGLMAESEDGIYSFSEYPSSGAEYSVEASKSGFPTVSSKDVIPNRKTNPEIKKIESKSNEYGDNIRHITYSIDDAPGTDYYEVLLFTYTPRYEYYSDEDTSYEYFAGYYKEQYYYNLVGAELNEFEDTGDPSVFSDDLFDGKQHTNTIEIYYYYYNNPNIETPDDDEARFTLEVRNLSEALYLYKNSLQLQQDTRDNPFAEAAQVYNNINGGFGIFGGYAVSTVSFTIKPNE